MPSSTTTTLLTLLASLTSLTSAIPTPSPPSPHLHSLHARYTGYGYASDPNITLAPTDFYLITTTSALSAANSSSLPNATALSLFSPYYQDNWWLRAIDPGYLSLPRFNLTNGTLHTVAAGSHGIGTFVWNSTTPGSGELEFYAKETGEGAVGLKDGYLVTVKGQEKGWQLCEKNGEDRSKYIGQTVLNWRSNNTECRSVYLQAVATPPY